MDTAQQNDTNLRGKNKKKEELMLDLTVVSVESLLNTVHTCSSQRATGNCNIYKPEEKTTVTTITIIFQTQKSLEKKKKS